MPEISVIVPVYNAEKHIHQCIDSIISQTFIDFELLLIDDGSNDKSGVICDEYAQKDSRIRVFHKENGGVSSARNSGIDNAKGDWIAFVDSDDFIPNNALQNLINNNCEDLIIGGYKNHFSDQLESLCADNKHIKNTDFGSFLSLNIDTVFFRTPWAKLFKKEILDKENLRFNNALVFGEDTVFVTTYLLYCKSIKIINIYCYNYYNIGENYINKYIKHSDAIFCYFEEITRLYKQLNLLYSLSGSRSVYGFIFDILKRSYDEKKIKTEVFVTFLTNPYVKETLSKRNSFHIKILLFLAKYSSEGLCVYNQITKRI